jgi:hypothetical protein
VRPSRNKTRELRAKLHKACAESVSALRNPELAARKHLNYVETLDRVSKVIHGWANTMAFCTDDRVMNDLDVEISKDIEEYGKRVASLVRGMPMLDRRRALGVFPLVDRVPSAARDEMLHVTAARRHTSVETVAANRVSGRATSPVGRLVPRAQDRAG